MKRKLGLTLFLLAILISVYSVSPVIAQEGGHDEHENVENTCHDPTETLVIGLEGDEVAFNQTEFTVDKGACVMIMFVNDQDAEHDVALHFANGTEYFGLHIVGNGTMQMKMIHAQMPDEDMTMPFWCTVEDHKDQGMEGVIIVGEGSADEDRAPGFGLFTAFIALTALFIALPRIRRN